MSNVVAIIASLQRHLNPSTSPFYYHLKDDSGNDSDGKDDDFDDFQMILWNRSFLFPNFKLWTWDIYSWAEVWTLYVDCGRSRNLAFRHVDKLQCDAIACFYSVLYSTNIRRQRQTTKRWESWIILSLCHVYTVQDMISRRLRYALAGQWTISGRVVY